MCYITNDYCHLFHSLITHMVSNIMRYSKIFFFFFSRLSWNKKRDIQKEMDGQNEEWNDEREEKQEPSDGWARRHLGEEVGGGEDGEWEQIKQTKKRKKEKEEGRMVACLNCDRAPRGFWVVHVWVYEHGKKKLVPLQGFVSVYMSEGGGRAGWGGALLIASFPFLPECTGRFERAERWGSSAVPHRLTWPVTWMQNKHTAGVD